MYYFDQTRMHDYIQTVTPETFEHLCGYFQEFGILYYQSEDYVRELKKFTQRDLSLFSKEELIQLFGLLIHELKQCYQERERVWHEQYGHWLERHQALMKEQFESLGFPIQFIDQQWFFDAWNDAHFPISISECPSKSNRLGYVYVYVSGWSRFYALHEIARMNGSERDTLNQQIKTSNLQEKWREIMPQILAADEKFVTECREQKINLSIFEYCIR